MDINSVFYSKLVRVVVRFCCLIAISPLALGQTATMNIKWDIPAEVYYSQRPSISSGGGIYPMSADGLTIVGKVERDSVDDEAFRWSSTSGLQMLGDLPGGRVQSNATATINDGSIVVGGSWGSTSAGLLFLWNEAGGMTLADPVPTGFIQVRPKGVSDTPLFVVGDLVTSAAGLDPFIWSEADGFLPFGRLGIGSTNAVDVSDDGSVVVGYGVNADGNTEAYRWTQPSGFTLLGDLPGHDFRSQALAVSGDGSTVVGSSSMRETCGGQCSVVVSNRAFRWTFSKGMEDLGFASGQTSNEAYSVSNDGRVILVSAGSSGNFIWREGVGLENFTSYLNNETLFDTTDWVLRPLRVIEVGDQTVIAGVGQRGQESPVLWHLVMEASTLPDVSVASPLSNTTVGYNDFINFSGSAMDQVDGDVSDSIIWHSSIDGVIGSGTPLSLQLTVGMHAIYAEVTSSGGTQQSQGVTVNVVNATPVVSINTPSTNINTGGTVDLSASAIDDEDGDITSLISWSSSIDGFLGQGGNVSVTLTEGVHSVTATVVDQVGELANDAIRVSVLNEAPLAITDTIELSEGAAATVNLALNDSDSVEGLDLTSIALVSQPANGNVAINTQGFVTYTHNGSETTFDSFTYTIQDLARKASNVATVNIAVSPVNDAPIANDDVFSVVAGESIVFSIIANDVDLDSNLDLQSIQIVSDVSFGTLLENSDGTVTYTSNVSGGLLDNFTYSVSDESGMVSNIATVLITTTLVNSSLFPLEYDFDQGLPREVEGWTYYSSNSVEGRIQVADGGLRMDVITSGNFSLNEAVLSADLSGARDVELSFFQSDHGDELTEMPEEFTGHHNSDGVAISVDGVNWYRVLASNKLDVTTSGQAYSVNLSLLEQQIKAQSNASFSLGVNTLIKFQQYDNYSYPTDGRVWDNVKIDAVVSALSISSPKTIEVSIPQDAVSLEACELIQFENTADSSLSWFITLSEQWLSSDLTQGEVLANDTVSLDVCWNANGLAEGSTQQASITLTNGDSGLSQAIDIAVTRLSLGLNINETFSDALPLSGWEYYSSNATQGRIQVINGRLGMDVNQNGSFSLNEAVMTLNLTGQTGVLVSFEQAETSDESHAMPVTFTGHHNSDGVAISADGITWYLIVSSASLDIGDNLTAFTIQLDDEIQRIQSTYDVGFGYSSNFKIKFQQYDNYSSPTDGRTWDNISISN